MKILIPNPLCGYTVCFDIGTQNISLGRLEMVVYDDLVPKTAKNIKALAKGAF